MSEVVLHLNALDLHSNLAYLDGGTGSMLLQAALAGILSAAFVVKTQWRNLKAVLAGRRNHRHEP